VSDKREFSAVDAEHGDAAVGAVGSVEELAVGMDGDFGAARRGGSGRRAARIEVSAFGVPAERAHRGGQLVQHKYEPAVGRECEMARSGAGCELRGACLRQCALCGVEAIDKYFVQAQIGDEQKAIVG